MSSEYDNLVFEREDALKRVAIAASVGDNEALEEAILEAAAILEKLKAIYKELGV